MSRLYVSKFITGGNTFVAKDGHLFWNQDERELRIGDGVTPGGLPIIGDLSEKAYVNYFDHSSQQITPITTTDVWEKLNSSTILALSRDGFQHTNNRITNIGLPKVVKAEGIISIQTIASDLEIHLSFFKNGQLLPSSEHSVFTKSHGGNHFASAVPFQCITEFDTGDFLEVFIKNSTTAAQVTLEKLNVIITEL